MHFNGKNGSFDVSIRQLQDIEDCREVVRCLRSAFGESYIKPQMYSPERVLEMQQQGEISLYLAIAENGYAAGIMGWEQVAMFPETAELCTLVVLREYEGAGLGEALIRHVYEEVRRLDILSVFSYPIASHFKAQRCIAKLGAVSCGFLPSVFSTEIFSSGIKGHTNPKDSLTVVAFNLGKSNAGCLHIKQDYLMPATQTYTALGAEFTADFSEYPPESRLTEYEYRYDSAHSTLYININRIGEEFTQLMQELVSHGSSPVFTAQLCLNINDKAAVFAAELLEKSGLFFTGFHPLCDGREYCIYHYSGDVAFDIDDLDFIPSQSVFADYIRKVLT